MSEPCYECLTPIEPFVGGYPGGKKIPTHFLPNRQACTASQSPYRPAERPEASRGGQTPGNAVKTPGNSRNGRVWLNEISPEANIALWMNLVEEQSRRSGGQPFILDGDAYCVTEELGETIEALHRNDRPQVEDGFCDTYVASHVADLLLRRENETVRDYRPRLQVQWDKLDGATICAIFAGRLASYVRKPAKKTTERAKGVLDAVHTVRAAIRRELGVDFQRSMDAVLDILDKRLGEGYVMTTAGTAVKKADQ